MLLYCMKCLKTIHDRGACGAIVKNNLLPPRCGSFTNLSAASPMAMNTMSANKTEPGVTKRCFVMFSANQRTRRGNLAW